MKFEGFWMHHDVKEDVSAFISIGDHFVILLKGLKGERLVSVRFVYSRIDKNSIDLWETRRRAYFGRWTFELVEADGCTLIENGRKFELQRMNSVEDKLREQFERATACAESELLESQG